jgi:hypothetical protein
MNAIWVELLKARRSRLPWVTVLAFTTLALVGGLSSAARMSDGLIESTLVGALDADRDGAAPQPPATTSATAQTKTLSMTTTSPSPTRPLHR